MEKVFCWDARKGSYIEDVSKVEGSVTLGTGGFKRTEKGTAFYDRQSVINFGNLSAINTIGTGDFSIEFWVKKDGITKSVAGIIDKGSFATTNDFALYFNTSLLRLGVVTAASFGTVLVAADVGVWRHFIVTRQGNVYTVYKDNVFVAQITHSESLDWNNTKSVYVGARTGSLADNLDGFIGGIRIYKKALNVSERNRLYQSYLQLQITEKPVRGFELVKPTDLSYLKDTGLVAAYNMIPNGNTLVDISGNGNNGTILSGNSSREGMVHSIGNGITVKNGALINTLNYTICGRIKLNGLMNGDGVLFSNDDDSGNDIIDAIGFRAGQLSWNYDAAGTLKNGVTNTLAVGIWCDFVFTSNGGRTGTIKAYIDGTEQTITTTVFYRSGTDVRIFNRSNTNVPFIGECSDLRIYNYAFTPEQAKAYHNSWVKPVILEDWSGSAVSDVI